MGKGFSEAFRELGYHVEVPRQDWSAANESGVCMTLWRAEMGFEGGLPFFDTRLHAMPIEQWRHKPGNAKRLRHLRQAVDRHQGYIDVVIVQGVPGSGVRDAEPWHVARRKARWKIEELDETSGHLRVRAERLAG